MKIFCISNFNGCKDTIFFLKQKWELKKHQLPFKNKKAYAVGYAPKSSNNNISRGTPKS